MKIQYPGVANSIDSDIDNVKLLLDYTNLLPEKLYLDRAIIVSGASFNMTTSYLQIGCLAAMCCYLLTQSLLYTIFLCDMYNVYQHCLKSYLVSSWETSMYKQHIILLKKSFWSSYRLGEGQVRLS